MTEQWKDIQGYEGRYQVSNYGRVKSLRRTDRNGHPRQEKILSQCKRSNGYLSVHLSRDMIAEWLYVHRLVAAAFVEKKDGADIVNHLDNNPGNNRADNLEWTTYVGNMRWAASQGRMKCNYANLQKAQASHKTPVVAIAKSGERLTFESQTLAAKSLGISKGHIAAACRKEYGYKTVGGYEWEYADPAVQAMQKPKKEKQDDATRREALRRRMLGNQYGKGKTPTREVRDALRQALGKPILQTDKTGRIVAEFKSAKEAREKTGIAHTEDVANGRRKSAGGYYWRWKN